MIMKNFLSIFLGFTLSLALVDAHAIEPTNVYKVEVIVFERSQRTQLSDQETWPRNVELSYPDRQATLIDPTKNSESRDPMAAKANESTITNPESPETLLNTFLGKQDKSLRDKRNALERRGFRILFHETWLQALTSPSKSPALPITGGRAYGRHYELEGYLKLSLGSYLQVESNLWLTEFETNNGQNNEQWPPLPLPHNRIKTTPTISDSTSIDGEVTQYQAWDTPNIEEYDEAIEEEPYSIQNISVLKQQRKMRSNELHYLDHPKMGLLIMVAPRQVEKTAP
jgi:Peptidoglycan-binding protein, CsiV